MSFDSATRNKLAKFVSEARTLLVGEFGEQLQEIYGIRKDGTVLPLEKLAHLTDTERAKASLLREQIDHVLSGMAVTLRSKAAEAVDRIIREQAFTLFNRFCALRMAEERDLVQECVGGGFQSKGFRVFETVAGTGIGSTYERYKVFLFSLFDEISLDLGVLFDRFSHMGLLFPRENSLKTLLGLLHDSELKPLWPEDETIGWIYQYWNSKDERQLMRKASAAPRNSRELAVRNQFFTPRYVVEFLTDNTLGRIWYEMRKGDTVLKEDCRYLVRRPNEIFLASGEKAPTVQENETDLSQEELLKKAVHIEHRPKKDPRDLKVLDPACGSGHFLLYAFDLLERIYQEAWEDPESPESEVTGRTLLDEFETIGELRQALPKLIIEHNLHGIDIDPRAVQISALAIWLRAQKTWKNLGIKAADRAQVTKSNIVTAEPMPGEEDTRREFTAGLKPRVLGQLVDVVFDKMKLAGEAGSLLKIEEEIKDAVAEARKQWLEGPKPEQHLLFSGMAYPRHKQQKFSFDHKGVNDERFWEQAEDRILDALKEYAAQMENGHAIRRRLFSKDAARGFAFIDLCRKRYDVVLMNPPFGESSSVIAKYMEHRYRFWTKNLLCASIIRAQEILGQKGLVGVIFDRTAAIKTSYEKFRAEYLDPRIVAVADTGWDVLDANVETTIHVLADHTQKMLSSFFDVRDILPEEKDTILSEIISDLKEAVPVEGLYLVKPITFLRLPNAIVGYYFDELLLNLFSQWRNLAESNLQARQGHALVSEEHFRLFWEMGDEGDIGKNKLFCILYNGAEFSLFASPLRDVTKFGNDGFAVKHHPSVVLRNPDYQFLSGIGYGKRGDIIDAHALPPNGIFTSEGQAITGIDKESALIGLSFLNSSLAQYTINQYCGQHKHCGYINLLPLPEFSIDGRKQVISNAEKIIEIKKGWFEYDETTLDFRHPLLVECTNPTKDSLAILLAELLRAYEEDFSAVRSRISNNDRFFMESARLSQKQVTKLQNYILRRPEDTPWPDMERDEGMDTKKFFTKEIVSHLIGIIFGRWDIRIAINPSLAPRLLDTFDPLPVCPPSMLVGPDGLPSEPGRIVSDEWLRARPHANTILAAGAVKNPTIPDSDYPLRVSWDGILVDDPGFNGGQPHRDDIVRRVREVLDLLWKDKAHEIEQEACDILGVSELRDYFRRPAGFFQDHLKRYSKSRRQAPIYWPLSIESGSYTLWIYYHRLDDQILFKCVRIVELKIKEVGDDIEHLKKEMVDSGNKKQRGDLEKLLDFYQEMVDFRDELLRVAKFYKPDLNDGVIINAAPFWKLFRLKKWQKSCKQCWDKLEAGEYDWSHMAMNLHPDQVREKCKSDKSLAIAHGLEELYIEPENLKKKRKRKKTKT